LTDPEILELRFPVRLLEFSIRQGSGGTGLHRGGHGIVRRLEFLRPLNSRSPPSRAVRIRRSKAGGGPGQLGRNTLVRVDGSIETAGRAKFKSNGDNSSWNRPAVAGTDVRENSDLLIA
jgi:5-oxoprolinase (ATP-hydrolysing)